MNESKIDDENTVSVEIFKPKAKGSEKIAIGVKEAEKINNWIQQVSDSSKGFLSLNKSDIVNFLISESRDQLLPLQLKRIKSDHYDPLKHINWITPQIKLALSQKDAARVSELQAELRSVELAIIEKVGMDADHPLDTQETLKGPRRRRKKTEPVPTEQHSPTEISLRTTAEPQGSFQTT